MEDKPVVPVALFAFGSGQGVFLVRVRMQENGEIAAYRPEARARHVVGRGIDDHPVTLVDGKAKKSVPYGTTHEIGFHGLRCRRR